MMRIVRRARPTVVQCAVMVAARRTRILIRVWLIVRMWQVRVRQTGHAPGGLAAVTAITCVTILRIVVMPVRGAVIASWTSSVILFVLDASLASYAGVLHGEVRTLGSPK